MNMQVEKLGRLAAECDLKAQNPDILEHERLNLMRQAAIFRDAQARELHIALGDEQPYPFWNVLTEPDPTTWMVAKILLIASFLALLAAAGYLGWMHAHRLF